MNILVIGSGGREHALAWSLSLSKNVNQVFVAPGNPGMSLDGGICCTGVAANDFEKIKNICFEKKIEFVVVGPDQSLADGLVDYLELANIPTFGPTQKAAQLESSKAFAKEIMMAANIPTAEYRSFTNVIEAKNYIQNVQWKNGYVIKADGLALGKGVVVCKNKDDALETVAIFLEEGKLGPSGKKIIIEECLIGKEASAFVFCDGKNAKFFTFACDYKQLLNGGNGPNTGGMGAYAPTHWLGAADEENVIHKISMPLLNEMEKRSIPYKGILFVGLMFTDNGPKVLEFHARFGDPETQAILPLLDEDLLPWLIACRNTTLSKMPTKISLKKKNTVHVVMAAEGYPDAEKIKKGEAIEFSETKTASSEDVQKKIFKKIFFAGVAVQNTSSSKELKTSGGRVLGLTAMANSREVARDVAYAELGNIHFAGAQWRTDVGE